MLVGGGEFKPPSDTSSDPRVDAFIKSATAVVGLVTTSWISASVKPYPVVARRRGILGGSGSLADDVLIGKRVGRAWVIESEQLRQVAHRRPEVGRPWSPVSAWALLALADGEDPDLSPVQRSRARKRLAEGYVRAGDFDDLVSQFGLDDQAARSNVLLRVVDDAVWPFQSSQVAAGRAVVAIDLLESDDPRSRRAGADLVVHE